MTPVPVGGPEPEPRRGGWATPLIAIVALVALALLAWQLLNSGDDPETTPSATPTPSVSTAPATSEPPPTTEAPTPTPTPTTEAPTPTPDPSEAVASSLDAFSDEVGSLRRGDVLDNDTAKTLDDRVRDIDNALGDEDPQKVADETEKLREDYDKARADGDISDDAASSLDPLLQDVEDAVAEYLAG